MTSYYIVKRGEKTEEMPQYLIDKYRRYVASGKVPTSGIPYTRTGVEEYRHRSSLDEIDTSVRYPSWQKGEGLRREIISSGRAGGGGVAKNHGAAYPMPPKSIKSVIEYVTSFNALRNLRE